ncbi:ABC transporter ATP-binding protein [Acetivibrio mesophilus]|uniref:ABC transporter ATP-binding protein n=1 Tax=Acetivibrio mesophilus TaxID=2487273 RepID=A0A4Q0I108_9FIRM|nr:ABC transporter ATP-binding protein [Acetivibrio mesophilus]ODM27859.1 multidrug ABC transporter ATP-binding protein [Clostridium sp. Bc-iso-3]RXE57741.1 ABC transporter ATP-binding protein [Acetivibrio mesophilus]
MNAIEVRELSKSYDGEKYALEGISFSIPQGEIFGFLGPNGSGKTTTVRILNGILSPSGGSASVMNVDVLKDPVKIHSFCGVMTETALAYENLTGEENLRFFGSMHGLTKDEIRERSDRILKSLELYEVKDKKVKSYSTGMKKRIQLAKALLHNPKILFLDEPTSGLDPEAAMNVTQMIRKLSKENGVTVLLCTHQLKYAEEICTLYGFIDKGKMLGFGTLSQLLSKKNSSVFLEIRGENIPKIDKLENKEDRTMRIPIKDDAEASALIQEIIAKGGKIYEARQVRWNLEDLYFAYQKEGTK